LTTLAAVRSSRQVRHSGRRCCPQRRGPTQCTSTRSLRHRRFVAGAVVASGRPPGGRPVAPGHRVPVRPVCL